MKRLIAGILVLAAVLSIGAQQFKHYQDENDRQQAAMEGKTPPKFVATEWVNSKPLDWAKLKGKVVLLDLWAYW